MDQLPHRWFPVVLKVKELINENNSSERNSSVNWKKNK